MEGFKKPSSPFMWMVDAFFRLHRRRQFYESGYQPMPYQEISAFADLVLKVPSSLRTLFFRVIEETDNGVLYDSYVKAKQAHEEAAAKQPKPRKPRRKS